MPIPIQRLWSPMISGMGHDFQDFFMPTIKVYSWPLIFLFSIKRYCETNYKIIGWKLKLSILWWERKKLAIRRNHPPMDHAHTHKSIIKTSVIGNFKEPIVLLYCFPSFFLQSISHIQTNMKLIPYTLSPLAKSLTMMSKML